ncbi:MAG: M20/M25/M40 family metallo-hydrolase [Treponema sp.]|nr:M20/M25/M40 family metallo-hydrolase [Treponema sp.]
MDKQKTLTFIKELSDANGVSGFEDEAVAVIRRHSDGLGQISEDAMRNLYIRRSGWKDGRPSLMIDAHTDEVGFMVRNIRSNGTLDFVPLGGWVASAVAAHKVRVRTVNGQWIPGIIASKPPHFMSEAERKQAPEISNMVIDVGAGSDREAKEDLGVSIGAPVVPDVHFEYREKQDIMIGKAFDNRLGSAAITTTLKELAGAELGVNVTGAYATQEEVGLRGATVTAQTVKPDICIAFEGSPADDTLSDSGAIQTAVKKGPMLRHYDMRMITNPRFQRFALNTAKEKNIPVQEAVRTGGATDGGVIHLSGKAVPVIVIGIPARYIHTHHSISSYSDFENSVRLACEVIKRLNADVIAGF